MRVFQIAARKIAADEMALGEVQTAEVETGKVALLHHHAPAVRDALEIALMQFAEFLERFLADTAADDGIVISHLAPRGIRRAGRIGRIRLAGGWLGTI